MLQEWLRDRCVPAVATLVTEDADLACRKNNLSFEQLISAFGRMDGLKVPFRSSSQQYSLESFSCRFMRGSSMRPAPASEGDPSLAEIAVRVTAEVSVKAAAAAKAVDNEGAAGTAGSGGNAAAAGDLLDSSAVEDQEWYKRYRAKLWDGLCHQEHEMLDCPAAVLVVVSSTEASGDPIACFDELSSTRYLPPPFQSRQYDPQMPTLVYVLLHDWCLGAAQGVDPDRLLSQMRGTFPASQCRLLCINSLPAESPNLSQKDIWPDAPQKSVTVASGAAEGGVDGGAGGVRGCCLSPEDLVSTRDFVHGLATQVVVPSMERRILSLNATVSSVRKGVKNFMKSWLRKPRDSIEMHGADGGGAGGAKYRFDRIESQIRLLADSTFLMRDFDTAASMYRMARDDFKSDRSLLHYASASEMLAISLYLQQQRRSSSTAVGSPGGTGGYAASPSSGGLSGAIGGAIVGGVVTAAATAANVATAAGAAGARDLSWHASGAAASPPAAGQQQQPQPQQQYPHSASAPNSSSGGGGGGGGVGGIAMNPTALLGRGREADAAFAAALEAYQRRASEDSVAAGYGGGSGGGGAMLPPAARLGARAALLYADVAAAASEDHSDRNGPRNGAGGVGEELQAQAEEALLNASVLENPLCAAVLLEVSANRCRAAGRERRAAFRLIQAGHMYKTFAKDSGEAYRQQRQLRQPGGPTGGEAALTATGPTAAAAAAAATATPSPKFVGMHAARCFLGALSGYSGSGWLAAEEYACTVLPTELRALQRPVAALQLYVRLVAAATAAAARRTSAEGSGSAGTSLGGASMHSQQQQQQQKMQKRASRETSLLLALEDLCWRYPDAARVAARAWERGRESSKLDMSFFPITGRAGGPPPPSRQTHAATPQPGRPTHDNADLLGIDFDSEGVEAPAAASGAAGSSAGGGGGVGEGGIGECSAAGGPAVTRGVGEGVVFEGLSLPGVVHEETRAVDTENASVEASLKATGATSWAHEMADALKAELAAAEGVQEGKGPWLTLSASYAHQAGTSSSAKKPSHLPPPPRSAPVGEPVTIAVVLENPLTVPVSVEDMQLVLTTTPAAGGAVGGSGEAEEEEVSCIALDEEEFHKMFFSPATSAPPAVNNQDSLVELFGAAPTPAPDAATAASVAIERRRATVPPGERLRVLLKFCALRPAAATLTASAVRWTVFQWNSGNKAGGVAAAEGERCPPVWVSHRLEGRGKLLLATLEQRAARARAPAPPPRFEATGSMPWLGVSLEGVPPTLLQGEVVRATMKFTNMGRAPAGHLCLKTNLPWVAFERPAESGAGSSTERNKSGSEGATGGAVGASGTTLIPPVGVVKPGESVALPLWVRGRGGGRQTVRMLVRYRRALPSSAEDGGGDGEEGGKGGAASSDDKLFRLERYAPVSVEMCVLPSLSVAASVLPSYSRRGEYVLSLEATNYRSNGDELSGNKHLRIHKVCAISRCWKMEPLAGFPQGEECGVGPGAGGDAEGGGSGTVVHWQERVTLHYRLFPVEGSDVTDGEEAPAVRHNDCRLGAVGSSKMNDKVAGSADSPHLPLLCLEQAASNYYLACRKHRQQKLAEEAAAADEQPRTIQGVRKDRQKENAIEALQKEKEEEEKRWRTQRRAHPTSPGALCAPDLSLVHLMVLWGLDGHGEGPPRVGQHHVRSLVIRPERVDRQCPLVLTVKYPSEVSWDQNGRDGAEQCDGQGRTGCDADVIVCATNRLAGPGDNAKVNFTFEVRSDDGPRRLSTVPGAPPPSASGAGGQGSSAKRPPRNRFVWLGPTRRRVVGLGPGEATTIPLKVRFLRPGVFDLNRFRFVVEFAPPAAGNGKPGAVSPSPPQVPPQQQQQQRRDSSASQQGRVTFVFPAQYLVTVAPPLQPTLSPSAAIENSEALLGTGMGGIASAVSLEEVLVA